MTTSDGTRVADAEASNATPADVAATDAAQADGTVREPPAVSDRGPRSVWRSRLRTAIEVALFVGLYLAMSSYQERNLLAKGALAPELRLTALDGREVSLDSLRGKRVVVHFWATWCGVCRQEFGALNAVHRGLGADEALVSVVADADDVPRIREFVAKEHIDYPVLLGTEAAIRAYRVSAFPTNYFLDSKGRIAGHTVGMSTRVSLVARLALAR